MPRSRSRCAFSGCTNYKSMPGLTMFCFPKDPDRMYSWRRNCNNADLLSYSDRQMSQFQVCEKHFDNDSFMNYEHKKLVPTAIPTLDANTDDGNVDFQVIALPFATVSTPPVVQSNILKVSSPCAIESSLRLPHSCVRYADANMSTQHPAVSRDVLEGTGMRAEIKKEAEEDDLANMPDFEHVNMDHFQGTGMLSEVKEEPKEDSPVKMPEFEHLNMDRYQAKTVKASLGSTSNLRKHIMKVHPSQVSRMIPVESGNKRKTSEDGDVDADDNLDVPAPCGSRAMSPKRQLLSDDFQRGLSYSQTNFNELLTKWIVNGFHSFSTVDNADFRELIKAAGSGSTKTVMSRNTFLKFFDKQVTEQKKVLAVMLSRIEFVATTADIWTTHNRTYVGVTVHWIDPVSFERRMAVLACRRVFGCLTCDSLSRLLDAVHEQFGIQNKIVSTTTDNGSNFVKAFRVYWSNGNVDQSKAQLESKEGDEEDEDKISFVDVGDILDEESTCMITLPHHERCAAHTLNLVASEGADLAAKDDAEYRRKARNTLAKCSALWTKQSRSALHADIVKEICGRDLPAPKCARWNSLYDAMACLQQATTNMEALNHAFDELELTRFNHEDISFIGEYCQVMKPLACALDQLQAEKSAYAAILLPTIHCLRRRLVSIKEARELQICKPLVTALISGLYTKFSSQWFRKDLVLAAVLHPSFHFSWIKHEGNETKARLWLHTAVRKVTPPSASTAPSSSSKTFFDFDQPYSSSVLSSYTEINRFLAFPSKDLNILHSCPSITKLFLEYNTSIPSSAGVETVFSVGGQVFSERRGKMSDTDFENAVILKAGLK